MNEQIAKSSSANDFSRCQHRTPSTGEITELESAVDINHVLSKLFILLSQNRISSRRAAVLAYIGNLLLRTLPAIEHELYPAMRSHRSSLSGPVRWATRP